MNIGHALEAMQADKKVARAGWNGKGMFIIYVPSTPKVDPRAGSPYDKALEGTDKEHFTVDIDAHIDMYTAQGTFQPGWLCSQADLLATDWEVVGEVDPS